MLESALQKKIIKDLERSGWLVNKIKLCTVNGWPDVLAIKKTTVKVVTGCRVLFIEVKKPNEKPKKLQLYVHSLIAAQGGEVHVIDSWESYLQIKYLL